MSDKKVLDNFKTKDFLIKKKTNKKPKKPNPLHF